LLFLFFYSFFMTGPAAPSCSEYVGAIEHVGSALEAAGPRYIARVCGHVEYGTRLLVLLKRSATWRALVDAPGDDGPIDVRALRGIDPRDIALSFLAPVFAETGECDPDDLDVEPFVAYVTGRLVVSRAKTARERAAETLIDALDEHVGHEYIDAELGTGYGLRAHAYAGEDLTRYVFSASPTMVGIVALTAPTAPGAPAALGARGPPGATGAQSVAFGFPPLDEELGTMAATEHVVVPVLAALLEVDRATVLRSLFFRMAHATPTPLGPWCSAWCKDLTESDVVALVPRLVSLGLVAALRDVPNARILVAEGLARDPTTRARMTPADVANVARSLTPRAVECLADSPRHAATIMRVFADDAMVVRRAARATDDLAAVVEMMRTVRDWRSVAAVTEAVSRIVTDSIVTDSSGSALIDALNKCDVVAAIRAMDEDAFERTLDAFSCASSKARALCAFVLERLATNDPVSRKRGTELFDACFS
jgi:hypothetical protein